MSDWSNELVLEFLELYQAEPIIFDPKHKDYKNKVKVNDAWLRIKRALSAIVPVAEIKRKKDSLMAAFRHHLRRKKASIKAGATSDEVYKPSWYAYEFMEEFLGPLYDFDPALNTENLVLSDEQMHEEDDKMQEENSSNCDAPLKPTPKPRPPTPSRSAAQRHKRRPQESQHVKQEVDEAFDILQDMRKQELQHAKQQMDQACAIMQDMRKKELQHSKQQIDQAFAVMQDMRTKGDDECDLYGKLIAKKLRRMPEPEREKLMYEIDGHFLRANKTNESE